MIAVALSFLSSRVGMIALALVIGFGVGHRAATKGEDARRFVSEAAELKTRLRASEAAAAQASMEVQRANSLGRELSEKVKSYEAELASRPQGDVCRLTDSDIKRLRGLQ